MKYDFDTVHDRKNTGSIKWDAVSYIFGDEDVIPMWVADMDLPAASPIVDALKKRAEHPFYGYTRPGKELLQLIADRLEKKFEWKIDPEWIVFTPGVIPALRVAIKTITRPGDEIIIQEPVYYPFFPLIMNCGCQICSNPLKLIGGNYEMDYDDLALKFRPKVGLTEYPSKVKAIIFCNPHNPVGRVWTEDEIMRMGTIVVENGGIVISDEIHCDIIYSGYKHISFAKLSKDFEQNCIICMSPSKTYNLAGLQIATIVIPNDKLRKEFQSLGSTLYPLPNLFALVALEAAYRYGDEWLSQVLLYIEENLNYAIEFINKRIPSVKVVRPQGTYLLWLDFRDLGLTDLDLRNFLRQVAKVGLDDGFVFGKSGSGFQRMNIACPRSLLEKALKRIESAINQIQ